MRSSARKPESIQEVCQPLPDTRTNGKVKPRVLASFTRLALQNINRWVYCHHHQGMVTMKPLGRDKAQQIAVLFCPECHGEVEIPW